MKSAGRTVGLASEVLFGSAASCSDIIFLGAGHFTQSPAAPCNLGRQFS